MVFILVFYHVTGVMPTPINSPLPKDSSFSSLTQQSTLFIERSALQNLEEIGEGMSIVTTVLLLDLKENWWWLIMWI